MIVGDALLRVDPRATRARVIAAMSSMLTDRSIIFDRFRLLQVLKTAQGEDATAAMIIPLLAAPDRGLRMQAIYELINQCPNAKALRSVLIDALASDDGGLRGEAALFFLEHEPAMAQRSIDIIAEQIVDPMNGSFLSPFSIKKIRDTSAGSITLLTPKLVELLARATKPSSRVSAIVALGEIGPDAISAVPALLTFSDSNDLNIATWAVASLLKIDPRPGRRGCRHCSNGSSRAAIRWFAAAQWLRCGTSAPRGRPRSRRFSKSRTKRIWRSRPRQSRRSQKSIPTRGAP